MLVKTCGKNSFECFTFLMEIEYLQVLLTILLISLQVALSIS